MSNKQPKQPLDPVQKRKMYEFLLLKKEQSIRKARTSFWEFCKAIDPDFYKESRPHLRHMCTVLQDFYEDKLMNPDTDKPYQNISINMPPRHGKSYTATMLAQWIFGRNAKRQLITVSYNQLLSIRFSQSVRDGIASEKGEGLDVTFTDIFPDVKIKHGDGSKGLWALEGSHLSYLATSFGASITGLGTQFGIVDDPVKDSIEAFNENLLQEKLDWYNNTFLSRVEKGGKKVIIATRWATKDLTGRLMDAEPDKWYELKMPACLNEETGQMLCDEIFDFEMYKAYKNTMSEEIFMANYQQEPMDVKGRLYTQLFTHADVPIPRSDTGVPLFEKIISYSDTADKGKDNFASLVAGVYQGQIWVLDILYTKEAMEETEVALSRMLKHWKVNEAVIESNNGGRLFASNVEKRLHGEGYRYTDIKPFHQSKNKEARILTNSSFVMKNIFFPEDWREIHTRFYQDIMSYQREGKNKHDDAPDALTGLAEMVHDATPMLKPAPRIF